MTQHRWTGEDRKYILCVDSYEDFVLKGSILSPGRQVEAFSSLSQFLLKMEQLLDLSQTPQAYTEPRRFSLILQPEMGTEPRSSDDSNRMTFELKILFRQHTSWQGILLWKEKGISHHFRSVLELVILLDSALRSMERSGCA